VTVIKAQVSPPIAVIQPSDFQVVLLISGLYGLFLFRSLMLLDDGSVFFKIQAMHCIAA